MKTTLNRIKQFNPCDYGWEKLKTYLGPNFPIDREFPVSEAVKSNGISHTFWLLRRIMEPEALKKLSVEFAGDCAERVLPVYEATYPDNLDPREALEAARKWLTDPTRINASFVTYVLAAHTAAYTASLAADAAACACADAAYAAAAYTASRAADAAYAAAHDARAARAAAAVDAARAAADVDDADDAAAVDAAAADAAELEWQKNRLIELLEGEEAAID
jgi:hypothetical protein